MHRGIHDDYCDIITDTAKIFEKKHTIVILGIFIIDGPQYFLELQRKVNTDKKTLQERLIGLKRTGLISQEFEMHGKVKKSKYSITEKGIFFEEVMDQIYIFGKKISHT